LHALTRLFQSVGDFTEQKSHLNQTLKLAREQGCDDWVTRVLEELSDVNGSLGFTKEGIQQAREALEIYQRLGSTVGQARCLRFLARLLLKDQKLDAAKKAASQAIDLLPEKGQEFLLFQSHRLLGDIYSSEGEREKAINHYDSAIAIALPFNWERDLFLIYYSLSELFLNQREFDSANAYIEQAKSHVVNNTLNLGRTMGQRAIIFFRQNRLEEAKSEVLRALDTYKELGAAKNVKGCRALLQQIEREMESQQGFL
jgi:tetratricopeptide (TPR) repeat protein